MTTSHLDLGCGATPRNPYGCDELHGVDLDVPSGADPRRFRAANVCLDPIPHADSSFDSVSAFDFLEHVPRVLGSADGRGTRFPVIELMNEIHRVLKPDGRFYALTPAYPRAESFQDPTHVNFITERTCHYFCGDKPMARMYGFTGSFALLRNEWAIHPEAFNADAAIKWSRRLKRWRYRRFGRLSHLMWEFACIKNTVSAAP